jgi:hypothetical protein
MTVRSIQGVTRGLAGAASVALLSMIASQASAYEPIMLEKLGVVRMAPPEASPAARETVTATPAAPAGSTEAAATDHAPAPDPAPYMIMLERLGAVRMARPQEIPAAAAQAASVEIADRN